MNGKLVSQQIVEQSYQMMANLFKQRNHRPTADQMKALKAIPETLTLMAMDEAEPFYYISSLDPGIGKTTGISSWVKTMCNKGKFGHVGILLCLDRLNQIEAFLDSCNLAEEQYGILVGKDSGHLNDRGVGNAAQILLTTKEQVLRRAKRRNFLDIEAFFYRGFPRPVRIWDESLLVGQPIAIDNWDIGALLKHAAECHEAVQYLDEMMQAIKLIGKTGIFSLPNIPIPEYQWRSLFAKQPDDVQELSDLLWLIAGTEVTITSSSKGPVIVDMYEALPNDFKPCLVTDASARIKTTYQFHDRHRKDIVWLPKSAKDYSQVNFYHVDLAAGKRVDKDEKYAAIQETTAIIDSIPSEKFLVVHHRSWDDLPKRICNSVQSPYRVEFLHWGIHTVHQ